VVALEAGLMRVRILFVLLPAVSLVSTLVEAAGWRSIEASADAPGFDRAAFHKTFDAAALEFFRQHLGGS